MNIQQFPYEILEMIFRLASSSPSSQGRGVLNFALVCQSWYMPACHILYERLKVGDFSQLLKCLTCQTQNKGILCKELELMPHHSAQDRLPKGYEQLFLYLPNLETISLQYFYRRYQFLQQLAKHSKLFKHVKEISSVSCDYSAKELPYFFICLSVFKNSLQHITLTAFDTTLLSNNDQYKTVLSFLSGFTSLTSLDITNEIYGGSLNLPSLCMFPIMQLCPNLVRFRFYTDFKEPERSYTYHFDHKNLRYMDITLPEITRSHINYMVSNITALKQLNIYTGKQWDPFNPSTPVKWLERLGPGCSTKFQNYLSSVEKVCFSAEENCRISNVENWSFGNGVIGNNRSVSTHISLVLANLTHQPYERKTIIEKCPKSIFYHCGADINELKLTINKFTLPNFLQTFTTSLNLSEGSIKSFYAQIFTSKTERVRYAQYLNFLKSILSHFTNICYIDMTLFPLSNSHYRIKAASNDIESENQRYDPSRSSIFLPQLTAIHSDTLAYATLTNIDSAKKIESAVKILSNTKYLKLRNCELNEERNLIITLDLSRALQLQQLEFDISNISYQRRAIFLQVELEKPNSTVYYKRLKERHHNEPLKFDSVDATSITEYEKRTSSRAFVIHIRSYDIKEIKICAGKFVNTIVYTNAH